MDDATTEELIRCPLCEDEKCLPIQITVTDRSGGGFAEICANCWEDIRTPICAACGESKEGTHRAERIYGPHDYAAQVCDSCRDRLVGGYRGSSA